MIITLVKTYSTYFADNTEEYDYHKFNIYADNIVVGSIELVDHLCEDKNGNVFNEKLFLGFKKKFKEGENNDFNEKMIIGYISNGLP